MSTPALPTDTDPPAGWQLHTRRSPVTQPWEPIYASAHPGAEGAPPAVALGLRVREAHCNARGFAHGGLLSALADNAMGLSAVAAAAEAAAADASAATAASAAGVAAAPDAGPATDGARSASARRRVAGAVTVGLSLDFVDSARIGEWLTVQPRVLRHGGTLAFTECHLYADGRLVARASASFRFV